VLGVSGNIEKMTKKPNIVKIIGILSGKGGVGKSSVTGLIGSSLNMKGYKVGILDADIGGSSIPKLFGVNDQKAVVENEDIKPVESRSGVKIMSLNFLMENEDAAIIWRGPLISKRIKQFYANVTWGDLDYLLIDLPPGTSDVPLTIMQSIPLNGIIIVSSPQDLVKFIVRKSAQMAKKLNISIIGMVENMSYYQCPDCGKKIYIFGKGKAIEAAQEMDIKLLAQIPIDPSFSKMCDDGEIETYAREDNDVIKRVHENILTKI